MKLSKLISSENKSIISIVGFGGKTTIMYKLAKELSINNRVLVTTTTKIFIPKIEDIDFLGIGKKECDKFRDINRNGIYVYGSKILENKKLKGIDPLEIEELKKEFKYILIEADGSKMKPIKGWNEWEPVISNYTNITIGVLGLDCLGLEINEENVHRVKEFNILTNSNIGEIIDIKHILSVIFNKNGLFKLSKGKRILFLNKCELIKSERLSNIIGEIVNKNKQIHVIDKIIYGSLNENKIRYINL